MTDAVEVQDHHLRKMIFVVVVCLDVSLSVCKLISKYFLFQGPLGFHIQGKLFDISHLPNTLLVFVPCFCFSCFKLVLCVLSLQGTASLMTEA